MIDYLDNWGVPPGSVRADIHLPGSPERCAERLAVEDHAGTVWMLERLHPGQTDRRERLGRSLAALSDAGLPVPAYLAASDGRFVVEADGFAWQLSPFVFGDPLPRPEFINEPERGEALGRFVAVLDRVGTVVGEADIGPAFVLEDYVNGFMNTVAERRPDVHEAMSPVLATLTPLFRAWHDLPVALCQGDFHPLNVIWQGRDVGAVIDWEFMGVRPRLFDVANCLGCVGIEEPRALVGGLASALLCTLRDEQVLDRTSLGLLPELVVGLRFAWMSEWLRKSDHEMVDMEIRFMRLLTNSLDTLLPAWNQLLER